MIDIQKFKKWENIEWISCEKHVSELQRKIYKESKCINKTKKRYTIKLDIWRDIE